MRKSYQERSKKYFDKQMRYSNSKSRFIFINFALSRVKSVACTSTLVLVGGTRGPTRMVVYISKARNGEQRF